jgi:hypothetical protein
MLILKCTQKAAKELGLIRGNLLQIPPEENVTLLGDWFVNPLRFGYTKTLLFANAITLYSILAEYKKTDLVDIGQFFRTNLKLNLRLEEVERERISKVLAEYQEVTLAKTDSRSVLGSMNDLAWMYKHRIVDRGGTKETDLDQVVRDINRTPQLKRDGKYSIDLLKERLAAVS